MEKVCGRAEEECPSISLYAPNTKCNPFPYCTVELGLYSNLGEDVSFGLAVTDADTELGFLSNFADALYHYADGFDVDEHVKEWAMSASENGVPRIADLLEDAEEIKRGLSKLETAAFAIIREMERSE